MEPLARDTLSTVVGGFSEIAAPRLTALPYDLDQKLFDGAANLVKRGIRRLATPVLR